MRRKPGVESIEGCITGWKSCSAKARGECVFGAGSEEGCCDDKDNMKNLLGEIKFWKVDPCIWHVYSY